MPRKFGVFVPFVTLWLASVGYALNENEPCTNPAGKLGRCINFRQCDQIFQLYNKPVLSPDDVRFIEQSLCGRSVADNKPLVCCADSAINPGARFPKKSLPKPPHCGADFSDRIYGGQKTLLNEFPWTALIEYRKSNGQTGFHCGGSLINSRYVVTAAHCIDPRGWKVSGVRLGEWDLTSVIDCLDDECANAPVNMGVEKIIVHEGYIPHKGLHNDIALIRLNRDVDMTQFVSPVCLPIDNAYRSRNIVGTKGWAVGWGQTETENASNVKLKVELKVQDLQSCSNAYRKSGAIIKDTQLCAGGVRGQDTCSGDSGGPLTKLAAANHFLYGVVSYGSKNCGTKGVPGVYTNVVKYIEWIENNIE